MNAHPFPPTTPTSCASAPPPDPPASATRPEPDSHVQDFQHPRAFYRLCWAVLCERWAAFMLTSTVAVMMCDRYGLSASSSLRWLGIISAANYVGTLPGGYLLDRLTDSRRGFALGSLFLLLGYVALSLPSLAVTYLAFTLLLAGHSLYKPSTNRILVGLFKMESRHMEGAQVLLHFTVNIGAAAGALLAGVLAKYAGWNVTYACAALVMSISGVLAWPNNITRLPSGKSPTPQPYKPTSVDPSHAQTIAGLTFAMFLFTLSTAQAEGALLLWSRDRIDRVLLGFEVPVAWFLAFPAVLVLLLAPIQIALLPRLKRRIGTSRLVALGLVAAALCFTALLPTTMWADRVSMAWLAASLSFFVLAELLIAPLGLAHLLRSTPPRLIGFATGLWYGAGAIGYFVSGQIGALWSKWPTQRVLALLILLPLLGALLVWKTQSASDQVSET